MFKMDDLRRSPSLRLKTLTIAARWSLGLLLVAWFVIISAWTALHLFIVPRIGELRPQLESRVSQALGVTVRIGAIAARSEGLVPSFEMSDVRLLDREGREALHLPRVIAALSPRSLWNLGFEQLYIERPQLDVRRAADGKIWIAGLDLANDQAADGQAADWLFSQTEVVIRGGTLQWTDELRALPTLALQQVDLVIRNKAHRHVFRLDATPPVDWGERFTLMANFRQSLLSVHAGQWRDWEGQLYAAFDRVDVSQLRRYASLAMEVEQGSGALRAWVDVKYGQVTGGTADVALSQVRATLGPQLTPLTLPTVTGRLGGKLLDGGFEFSTQDLQFETEDGLRWPGGNVHVKHVNGNGRAPELGELQADRLDLAALTQIAKHLPLNPRAHAALQAYAPKGLMERIQASWQGPMEAPSRFDAKGRVQRLDVAAQAAAPARDEKGQVKEQAMRLGSPGVQGASIDFDLNQAGGRANLVVQDGKLEFPGLFEEAVLPVTQLATDIHWQINGEKLAVQLPNLTFSNADAQGEAQLKWQTGESVHFPGVLDLQGSMSRANGARVHRYLPLEIDRQVRDYLRDAIPQGHASGLRFRVKGDLQNFPFIDARQGEFRISANVRDASFAYLPRSIQAPGDRPWPALTQFNGELLIDHSSLQLKNVSAKVAGTNDLRLVRSEATIPDFLHGATVNVNAEARGPLAEMLTVVVQGSPLAAMTGPVLARVSGSGQAAYQFKLSLPLATLEKSTVQGKVTLAGNDVQIAPELPRLARARGVVHFTENGFAISGGQARVLGGDLRAEGGTIMVPGARATGPAALRVQGQLTAEGLRQATELGALSRLAQKASGSTNYAFVLGVRRGVPEFQFSSNLQGLALNLPAPLNKAGDTTLPLRLATALTRESVPATPGTAAPLRDQLSIELGRLGSAQYIRDVSGDEARVLRGAVGIGLTAGEAVPMPAEGVAANINLGSLDVDAWEAILAPPSGTRTLPGGRAEGVPESLTGYLPTSLAIRARELTVAGHKFSQIVAGGSQQGQTWRANLNAQELSGYLEYHPASAANAGHLYARLARLVLAPSAASDVVALLEEQPRSIPNLDIVVDDMELRGKKLGRVEIEAINRGASAASRGGVAREWRLNKLNVITPEAVFTASGNWAVLSETGAPVTRPEAPRAPPERRRTVMNFKLDIADAGELLARLGMKEVVRAGKGKMEGQIAWAGSPLALDYPTLGGTFNVNVETGQFLKADPGMAKLLGVLSLQALPRRLILDFRDVFSTGFAFDFVRGDVRIEQGTAMTNNLQMKGVNAAVLMEGKADIAKETQDLKVVVVPELNAGTASLIATWINPAVGLGSFLAQLLLRRPLIDSATQEFHITGSWSDPTVTRLDAPTAGKKEGAR